MEVIVVTNNTEIPKLYTGVVYYGSSRDLYYLEEYYLNGKLHRIDGPAQIYYKIKHNVKTVKFFYLRGHFFDKKEDWFNYLTEEEKEKAIWNIDEWK